MLALPSGTVTFLFTDIEGSTALWERDRQAMTQAIDRHLQLLRSAIEAHGGVLFKTVGDGVQAAFSTAPAAVAAALDAQRSLVTATWSEIDHPLAVRMAIHTSAAEPRDGDFLTPGLNRLSRLLAAGHGRQMLLSAATQDLARDALPPGVSLRDLGEHPLRDLYRPERIFQLLHPDLPADFPPLRTLATRPNNLPVQPTPFLGREAQVAHVVDLMRRDDVRLLTISGPGGVGKTRLALQAAADLLESFPDGVWFVDLSPLTDAALVPAAIATVLGVRDEAIGLTDRFADVLGGKQLLLVLDNFERVVAAVPAVASLLARTPGVKVLATSRIPLHAYGEREYPLSPFPLPDLTDAPSVEAIRQYEAVRLFVERAQAVKPDFTVTSANAPAIAEICVRLDGLPLAIELAAAHVKVLPPQALLKRLEKRLPLLTGGSRTLPARQQTMRQTIAWSHDLLDAEAQAHFRRLSVFAGGFTLDAAEYVGERSAPPQRSAPLQVLDFVSTLVDTSLLRQEEGPDGEPRFRMLEMVREFGLERLEASREGTTTRDHHATYFLDLVGRGNVESADPVWLAVIDREHDNLRAALTWSQATGDHDTLLRLAGAQAIYWFYRGHLSEGQQRLNQALATPPDDAAPRPRAWALTAGALLANVSGDTDRAAALSTESFSWWERSGDAYGSTIARSVLGGVRVNQGRYDEAAALFAANEPYFRDNVGYLRETGHEDWIGHACFHRGLIAWAQGDDARARGLLREAKELFDRIGEPVLAFDPVRYLGLIACTAGDHEAAARWFCEEFSRLREHGSDATFAVGLADVATLAAAQGAWQPSVRLFAKAEALAKSEAVALTLPARDHYERAHERAREALGATAAVEAASGRALTLEQALAEADAVLACDRRCLPSESETLS